MKLGCSPMVDNPRFIADDVAPASSLPKAGLRDGGPSCDNGLCGRRPSMSVDCERCNVPLDILLLGLALSPRVLLLNVRHTEATFDSGSDLLLSRDSVLKPNFLRSEDVLELIEALLTDLARLCILPGPSEAF